MYSFSTSRRRLAAVVVGVAAIPVILLAAHPSTATGTTSGATTLSFDFRPETFKVIDMPPKAAGNELSPGDYFVLTNGLYQGGERVGALHATCVVTRKAATPERTRLLCSGSYKVPGGTLVGTALLRTSGQTSHIAVTGGTGQYAGASGTSTEVNNEDGSGTVTIELE